MLKKLMVKNWILSKIALISFRGRMLKSKNLKMGTSSKARFTLTVRTVNFYIAKSKRFDGLFVYFIVLGVCNTINLTEIGFFLWRIELSLRTKILEC